MLCQSVAARLTHLLLAAYPLQYAASFQNAYQASAAGCASSAASTCCSGRSYSLQHNASVLDAYSISVPALAYPCTVSARLGGAAGATVQVDPYSSTTAATTSISANISLPFPAASALAPSSNVLVANEDSSDLAGEHEMRQALISKLVWLPVCEQADEHYEPVNGAHPSRCVPVHQQQLTSPSTRRHHRPHTVLCISGADEQQPSQHERSRLGRLLHLPEQRSQQQLHERGRQHSLEPAVSAAQLQPSPGVQLLLHLPGRPCLHLPQPRQLAGTNKACVAFWHHERPVQLQSAASHQLEAKAQQLQ